MSPQPPDISGGYAPPVSPEATPTPEPAKRPRLPLILGVVAVVLLLAGIGGMAAYLLRDEPAVKAMSAWQLEQTQPLVGAQKACDPNKDGTQLADGNDTLLVNGAGDKDTTGLRLAQVTCVLDKLKTPQAVIGQLGQTRALDGRQTATWPGYSASWTYHPSQGLDLIITRS